MKISYSAPAKVILSGEHAVVYGKPALVSAIDLRLEFNIKPKLTTIFSRSEKDGSLDRDILFIASKIKEYLEKEKIRYKELAFDYEIKSNIPIGRGLGSSAALSSATVAAFLHFYCGKQFEKEIINNLAYQIEKHFHQNPSGVDNSTACFGGLIFYRKEFEFLKNISCLNFKIPKKIEKKLFLIDSGKPIETTVQMIGLVGKMYNQEPRLVKEVLNNVEKTTKRMMVAIIKEDVTFFKQCLLDNQILLEILGVVSKKAKLILKNLDKYGVGKITGAGGREANSGFILFLAEDKEKLEEFLKRKGINYYNFVPDYQGLRYEKNQS